MSILAWWPGPTPLRHRCWVAKLLPPFWQPTGPTRPLWRERSQEHWRCPAFAPSPSRASTPSTVPSSPFARFPRIASSILACGDLIPQFALRWNAGVNNYMTYVTADIPVGAYSSMRLANLGIGHWAIDAGGGYTYFNPQTGHEASAVLG